jgi:hypothetical protein
MSAPLEDPKTAGTRTASGRGCLPAIRRTLPREITNRTSELCGGKQPIWLFLYAYTAAGSETSHRHAAPIRPEPVWAIITELKGAKRC